MAGYPLPDEAKTLELLGALFEGLNVKRGGKFDASLAGGAWFGVFIAEHGAPVALCGADANLAASFGAALSMLPVSAAKDAAKARDLTELMLENVREIMNICTRLVMDGSLPHLRLDRLYPRRSLPAAAAQLLGAPGAHREFQVQLPKYGGGVLSVMTG